ncbi:MAG: M24 family metallopeptidase C-terminal domain-containing protein, partial [Paludibacteraceae bacterium]|nr:M24 family metallopeptidase C-terminal domain-containing protein [Paludibacteraceae bacterium]
GIRIENLVAVAEGEQSEFGRFLRFETLTLFPYDANLIDIELLTDEELDWVNDYHKRVWEELSPSVSDKKTLKWLGKMTSVIGR